MQHPVKEILFLSGSGTERSTSKNFPNRFIFAKEDIIDIPTLKKVGLIFPEGKNER